MRYGGGSPSPGIAPSLTHFDARKVVRAAILPKMRKKKNQRFRVLATDYDGALAQGGKVSAETIEALERLRQSGRKTVLVTGRELEDLQAVFSRIDLFDLAVTENGAVLYFPPTRTIRRLAPYLPSGVSLALQAHRVKPLRLGRVVISTHIDQNETVARALREYPTGVARIFNRDTLLLVPEGVDKATGLAAALAELAAPAEQCVGIGEAENDLCFLRACGCAVAVSNALPEVQEEADFVTQSAYGEGVVDLIEALLDDPEAKFPPFTEDEEDMVDGHCSPHLSWHA